MRHRRTFVLGAVVALLLLGFAGTAQADSGSGKGRAAVVDIQDRCDPDSFNAALNDPEHPEAPDACVGDGDTTFQEFLDEFADKGFVGHWRFHPDDLTVRAGQSVTAKNQGGEFHTFTEVDQFGPGCVSFLNENPDPDAPLPEVCEGNQVFIDTGVAQGDSLSVSDLEPGTHRFQCFIHPWMRTVVTVR
jgi:plastocyanin